MKSAYRKFDRKCHTGAFGLVRSTQVALVMPFGENTQPFVPGTLIGTVGRLPPAPVTAGLEHPGPSPGTWIGPVFPPGGVVVGLPFNPAVVACTAKALEFRIASAYRQFSRRNDGVADHGPAFNLAEIAPPPRTNRVPCRSRPFPTPRCKATAIPGG